MALTPEALGAACRELFAQVDRGDRYIEVKCDYNLKGGRDDTKIVDQKGRVQIHDDGLAIIWHRANAAYDDPGYQLRRFPDEGYDWLKIEVAKVIPKVPGEVLSADDTDKESGDDDAVVGWDQWYAKYYARYIDMMIELGGHENQQGMLIYDSLKAKLMGPVEGFNITSAQGQRARLFEVFCLWVKSAVEHGQGWDDPERSMLKLGDKLLVAIRDDVQAAGLGPDKINELHQKVTQQKKDYDVYGKALAEIKKHNKKNEKTDHEKGTKCGRCGRQGHYARACYAKFHAKGHELPANGVSPPENDGITGTRDFRKGGTGGAKPGAKKSVTSTGT